MKISIVALLGCVLLQPLACTHESQPPAYGSDLNDYDHASEGQPGSAPEARGRYTSSEEGPDVGGTNTTGSTGNHDGGATSAGGTTSTAGTATTGGTGAYNGGTSP